jgi:hypothetical protein
MLKLRFHVCREAWKRTRAKSEWESGKFFFSYSHVPWLKKTEGNIYCIFFIRSLTSSLTAKRRRKKNGGFDYFPTHTYIHKTLCPIHLQLECSFMEFADANVCISFQLFHSLHHTFRWTYHHPVSSIVLP